MPRSASGLVLVALLFAGCADDGPDQAAPATPASGTLVATVPTTVGTTVASTASTPSVPTNADGCGETPVRSDQSLPDWAADADLPSGRFVLSEEGNVLGYLFVDPLRVAPRTTA